MTVPIPKQIQDLLNFLDQSPTAWHAVSSLAETLKSHGFTLLHEKDPWILIPGERYFLIRNGSSLCAFILPHASPKQLHLLGSHVDSPSFKLKPHPEIRKNGMVLFGVEIYGAPLISSWLNRDLGLAGRVSFKDSHKAIREELVCLDQAPLTIPQLALHLDREVNEKGLLLNKQDHLNVFAALAEGLPTSPYLELLLRQKLDLKELFQFDLFLYPLEKARLIGYHQEMIASYRLDNLAGTHAALSALLHSLSPSENEIKMFMTWNDEETGSHTSQGATSPFLSQVLERILLSFHLGREEYFRLLSNSLCVSVDLAHALHPNYIDKHDAQHQPILGQGPVLKFNAQQRYATDSFSATPLQLLSKNHRISLQPYVNRNDIPCGTTIGPVTSSLLGIPTVDIGCGQLSMHSCRELMSCRDHLSLCQLLSLFLHESVVA